MTSEKNVRRSRKPEVIPWLHKMTREERSDMLDRDYLEQLQAAEEDVEAEVDLHEVNE